MGFLETLAGAAEAMRKTLPQITDLPPQQSTTGLLTQESSTGSQAITAQGRAAALKAARALVNALEAPEEKIIRISWSEVVACKIHVVSMGG